VSPKDAYPCEAHYNGKFTDGFSADDHKLFTCAHSTTAAVVVSQSDSLSSLRPSPPLDITFGVAPTGIQPRVPPLSARVGYRPFFECYNQGMSDKSAAGLTWILHETWCDTRLK
jgi:hypothetical protein